MSKADIARSAMCELLSIPPDVDLLAHLRCFVAVADERHFGRAAARLHVTQPALSRTIARLERTLGAQLFERTSRNVSLSSAGEVLLADAEHLVDRADRFLETAARARRGEIGTIRAGVPLGLPAATVATLARSFRDRHPGVGLDLRELPADARLGPGLDAALLVPELADGDPANVHRGPALIQPLGVLVPATSALAVRQELHLADLAGHALALLPIDRAGWDPDLLGACRRGGFEPVAIHRPEQPAFALGLVLAGEAIAFGDPGQAHDDIVWRPLVGRPVSRRLQPVWRDGGRGALFAQAAVRALREGDAWLRQDDDAAAPAAQPVPRPGSFA
jgi:DNA-binding transcriptional LysR family regulator